MINERGERYFMIKDRLIVSGGGGKHYEVISFIRGFSILTIVLMHLLQGYIKSCPSVMIKASAIGGTGVHVFFFCSGFGLYLSYLRKPIGFVDFMKKRMLRKSIMAILSRWQTSMGFPLIICCAGQRTESRSTRH